MINYLIKKTKLSYSSSSLGKKLIRRLASSPLYFKLMRVKIARQIKKDKKGPFNLVIETSNFCNARCLMCPYKTMKRTKRIMDKRTFGKIITRIKREKLPINKVFFSGMGEPLTDPKLIERIAAIKKLDLPVKLYTNASLLTTEISQKLIDLQVDEINISFNGTNAKEYKKIMSLDFQKTIKNINNLLRIKKRASSFIPIIQISSIVVGENEKSIRQHLKNWQGKVNSVTVSLAHQWGGGVEINSKFKTQNSKFKRIYPCRSLWHTFVIDSSGNFVICCRDYESKYVLGNIRSHTFTQIWENLTIKRFRYLHLKYSLKELPKMCQKCNFPYQEGVEWLMPRSLD